MTLCDISAEHHLNYKFIIIKIIMQLSNHFFQTPPIYSQEYLKFLMKWKSINAINNKIFTNITFKNKSKRKRNFIIYHFLVESKPHWRIDLLITASMNIYQTKKSILLVMKTCFSKGKLMKQFGTPTPTPSPTPF